MKTKFKGQVELLELNKAQMGVLSSPACEEVYSSLSNVEALSIREIAERVGKSPAAVGDQIAKLVKAGLAIKTGTRKRRSRTEALYASSAMRNTVKLGNDPSKAVSQYRKRFQAQIRQIGRQYDAADEAMKFDRSFIAFLSAHSLNAHISPEDSRLVKQKIKELMDLVQELDESDPDVRAQGGHVRVTVAAQMLPSINESKKLSDPS